MFSTPGGKPASATNFARRRADNGVCSAVLRTTVLPQVNAGPILAATAAWRTQTQTNTRDKKRNNKNTSLVCETNNETKSRPIRGKFQGMMAATTPTGSCLV